MLDARRCEGLLRDYCPSSKREITALLRSLKSGCPQRLIETGPIERAAAMHADDLKGSWAAEAWAFALALPFAPAVKDPTETLTNGTPSGNIRQTGSLAGSQAGPAAQSQSKNKTGNDKSGVFFGWLALWFIYAAVSHWYYGTRWNDLWPIKVFAGSPPPSRIPPSFTFPSTERRFLNPNNSFLNFDNPLPSQSKPSNQPSRFGTGN